MSWREAKRVSLARELERLSDRGLERRMRGLGSPQAARVNLDGRLVVNFSSNNYLGLASESALAKSAAQAATEWGTGSGASRLIVGNSLLHERLESELAAFHRAPSARLFNSGFNANVGALGSLVSAGDTVFSDALNHASIIDGCRLSRANVVVYRHRDMGHLRELLRAHDRGGSPGRKLIVSDAVFSMDGDLAPIEELTKLATEHETWLMIDEAHAIGVLGRQGAGLADMAGVGDEVDVRVGTLGKALGSFGGYVVGSTELCNLLVQRARSFVFTTALPPAVVAASSAALVWLRGAEGDERRERLGANIAKLARALEANELLEEGAGASAVFPVVVGAADRAMQASELLLERGVYAQGIRPPTVPRGTSRLRIAVMATHTTEDIELLVGGLAECRTRGLFG